MISFMTFIFVNTSLGSNWRNPSLISFSWTKPSLTFTTRYGSSGCKLSKGPIILDIKDRLNTICLRSKYQPLLRSYILWLSIAKRSIYLSKTLTDFLCAYVDRKIDCIRYEVGYLEDTVFRFQRAQMDKTLRILLSIIIH